MENILEVAQQESGLKSRRSAMLLGGAALAGLALSNSKPAEAQTTVTDADILNFALNLEFLEAQFYAYATTGAAYTGSIDSGDGNTKGGTVSIKSNPMVTFTDMNLQAFAKEVAMDEANHVAFLQGALNAGGANAAVAMPNIDLMASFNTLAVAAGLGSSFDPFSSQENFLIGAFIFEDVGVTAYQGAAPLISDNTYLDKALGIHLVEGYHAGSIRQRIFALGAPYTTTSQAIAAARASLDGSTASSSGRDDVGVSLVASGTNNGYSTIVDSVHSSLTTARTTTQVLNIVYGSTATPPAPGVFFPNGMNGLIK
jgi:hypothetical protein